MKKQKNNQKNNSNQKKSSNQTLPTIKFMIMVGNKNEFLKKPTNQIFEKQLIFW
jgi:hypothetical protein